MGSMQVSINCYVVLIFSLKYALQELSTCHCIQPNEFFSVRASMFISRSKTKL